MFCPSHNIYCCCFNVLAFNKMLREKTFFWACLQNIHSYTFIYLGSISTFNMYLCRYLQPWQAHFEAMLDNILSYFAMMENGWGPIVIEFQYSFHYSKRLLFKLTIIFHNTQETIWALIRYSRWVRPCLVWLDCRLQQTVWAAEFC